MSSNLGSISFSITPNQTIASQSNLEVTQSNFFNRDGSPHQAGLMSPRLGPIDNHQPCTVCREYRNNCLGHQGHITLAYPVINPCFRKFLVKLLSRYCASCDTLNKPSVTTKRRTCRSCKQDTLTPYQFEKPYLLRTESRVVLTPDQVEALVQRISPAVVKRDWGVSINPADLLIQNLLVTAPSVRPTTLLKGVMYTDDLSVKLQTIVEVNSRLASLKQRSQSVEEPVLEALLKRNKGLIYELLAYHVFSYIDNKTAGLPVAIHRGGKPIKSLLERIESKSGYFRQNLGAKRTDYSSRSVIGPYGDMQIGQAGISLSYAQKMSTPELITAANVQKYQRILQQAPAYPLIHQIEARNPAGTMVTYRVLDSNRADLLDKIKPGSIVHRSLVTGDWVVLNRQPTLHQYGMLAHHIIVLRQITSIEGQTLRINSAVCPPYNADFDGDQIMGIHPSRLAAVNQVSLLMGVAAKMTDRKNGKPIVGINRQKICMMNLLSRYPRTLSRVEVLRIVGPKALSRDLPETISSRQLLRYILPPGYCYSDGPAPQDLEIRQGVVVKGWFTKSNCARNSRWAQSLCSQLGSVAYYQLLNDMLKILQRYQRIQGITLSVQDYRSLYDAEAVREAKVRIVQGLEQGVNPNRSANTFLVNHVNKFLTGTRTDRNQAQILAASGASGSMMHLAQMTGIGGMRTVKGQSPEQYFSGCFKPYLHTKAGLMYAKGVTTGNYLKGFSDLDFLLDCMMARDGLVVANIKIRDVGYNMRKLSYSLNDLVVDQQAAVRDSQRRIVQVAFGGTGYNGWDYSPTALNGAVLRLIEGLPSGHLNPAQMRAMLSDQGYAKPVIQTVLLHTHALDKALDPQGLVLTAQSLLMPCGAPVGMVTAHAIGQRSGQMALDAKHAKQQKQRSMKDLFRLLEKTPLAPSLYISGPVSALQAFRQTHRLVRLCDTAKIQFHHDLGQISVVHPDVSGMDSVLERQGIKTYPGIHLRTQPDRLVLQVAPEVRSYRYYYALIESLKGIVHSGLSFVHQWTLDKARGRLYLEASDKNATLYRWISRQTLPEGCRVVYLSPLFAQKIGGVQLARKVLYQELTELRSEGLDVEKSYLSMLSDLMTATGKLKALSRSGVVAQKPPLTRCAFESTRRIVAELALSHRVDRLRNPISAVICGAPVRVGPGYFDVSF